MKLHKECEGCIGKVSFGGVYICGHIRPDSLQDRFIDECPCKECLVKVVCKRNCDFFTKHILMTTRRKI